MESNVSENSSDIVIIVIPLHTIVLIWTHSPPIHAPLSGNFTLPLVDHMRKLCFWTFKTVVVQLPSHVRFFATLCTAACQALHPSLPPVVCSKSCPLNQWCHPTISSSVIPFSFCLLSFPASGSFLMSYLFATDGQSIGALASASVAPMNIQVDFLQGGLVWSPRSPRYSREFSPTPQFKSINSSVLSLLYGPALTSIHDYWKNHSFDYMDLCWQSNVSAF